MILLGDKIKHEPVTLPDGEYVLTWVRSGSVWHLVSMVPLSEYLAS